MTSVWLIRWVIVALGAALGVVLIGRHHVVIGVLILAMAIARASLLVTIRKRRADFRAGRGRFGPPS